MTRSSHTIPPLETEDEVRAFLAAIVESSEDAIVGKTLDSVIRSWNPGAERLFGYTAEEIVGRSVLTLIPQERHHEEDTILSRLRRGERIEHLETVRVTKDGRRIDVSLTISPIRDSQGRLIGASKIARNVTEEKAAEESLRESEERFRTLADNIAQFAWMAHPDGSIFWYNQRWLDYTGTTLEDMEGWGWRAVHHPDHVAAVVEKFRLAIERGEHWEDTFPLRGADGEYRWFLSRALPIRNDDGEIVRWFGTNTDITERMEMEERLRADDRRKDQFLATLSHELRNPLAPIVGAVELLKRAADDEGPASAVATLERQTAHLVRLVDDLVDLSRITRGVVELRRARTDLRTILEHAIEASRSAIDDAEHELLLDLPDEPILLWADFTRLTQVFSNLLHNAARYSPRGTEIELQVERAGDELVVTVADSGPGIPADLRASVFDLFVQGDSGRRGGHAGLGIGLTLVRSLVELHRGSVAVRDRTSGRGVAFEVRLPALAGDQEQEQGQEREADERGASGEGSPANVSLEPIEARSLRILVVDDNRDAADTLSLLLETEGHTARAVYDGESALAAGAELEPDLVLLDLGMPGMDGVETARRIRRADWGRGVRLAALTGWGQESDRERTSAAGFDVHLVKPVEAGLLDELLASTAR